MIESTLVQYRTKAQIALVPSNSVKIGFNIIGLKQFVLYYSEQATKVHNMSTLRGTLNDLNRAAEVFSRELDHAGYSEYTFSPENSPYDLSFLSSEALGARGDVIAAAERILRLAKGPQGCLAGFADTVQRSLPSPNHCPVK